MKPLTPKMIAMLSWLDAEPMGIAGLPYRKGATQTARALCERGLVMSWMRVKARNLAITDAGRAALLALIPVVDP